MGVPHYPDDEGENDRTWSSSGCYSPQVPRVGPCFVSVIRPIANCHYYLRESLYHGEETGKSYIWNFPDK